MDIGFASGRRLTIKAFSQLADMPPEAQWFANLDSPQTRRAYKNDVRSFMTFVGIKNAEEFRDVARGHVLAWRAELECQQLAGSSIRRKLAALASLFEYLCDCNAVATNPVKGVKRPRVDSYEGKTPAIGDHQARQLLDAPDPSTLKGKRDRAILSVFLFHGLRREELCLLRVKDVLERRGVRHLMVRGKGGKTRYLPLHANSAERIEDYLEVAGHGQNRDGALFRPMRNPRGGTTDSALSAQGVYSHVVKAYGLKLGLTMERFAPHALRATAATNALDHEADISKVQEWLGHANISTTRIYDRRKSKPEDSPTFKVSY
jgi:integrase/recombinase XerD